MGEFILYSFLYCFGCRDIWSRSGLKNSGIKDFIAKTENSSENIIVSAFQKNATIGIPWEYDFAPELIALLDPEDASTPVCEYAHLVFG